MLAAGEGRLLGSSFECSRARDTRSYRGDESGLPFSSGSKMAPQAGQIIFSESALLISFGLTTLPHFGQLVFSAVSTLSQWIFLAIAELNTFARP